MNINTRSFLYRLAKFLGDARAVARGPVAMVKRVERRLAGKMTGRLLRKVVK